MATDGRLEAYQEAVFPDLSATGYRVTSPESRSYNCFAWAVEDSERWWNPLDPENPYYWVEGVPADLTMTAFIQAYAVFGFAPCENSELELGFEKIALYATPDGEPTHAARQLPNGK